MISLNNRNGAPEAGASAGAGRPNNLTLRIASAAVLLPVAVASIYVGGWLFFALCAAAAGGILWEWTRLIAEDSDARVLLPGGAALIVALGLTALDRPGAAVATIAIGALLAGGMVVFVPRRFPAPNRALWALAGVLYAGTAFLGPALLRGDPQWGLAALLFVAVTVWATDVFAYVAGRAIGGPLLWPQVSPHKTWAGAAGGLAGGVAAGTLVAYASGAGSGVGRLMMVGIVAALLSVLTQAGDLLESAVKRRFGAKDASHLIPGHGGLMDRLDGFLVAALGALVLGALHQGMDAAGQGLLIW